MPNAAFGVIPLLSISILQLMILTGVPIILLLYSLIAYCDLIIFGNVCTKSLGLTSYCVFNISILLSKIQCDKCVTDLT